jgi:hypothetical protein
VEHYNSSANNSCNLCSYRLDHEHSYYIFQQVQRRICTPLTFEVVGNYGCCYTHNHYRFPNSLLLFKEWLVRLGVSCRYILGQWNSALLLHMFWPVKPSHQNLWYVQSTGYSLRKHQQCRSLWLRSNLSNHLGWVARCLLAFGSTVHFYRVLDSVHINHIRHFNSNRLVSTMYCSWIQHWCFLLEHVCDLLWSRRLKCKCFPIVVCICSFGVISYWSELLDHCIVPRSIKLFKPRYSNGSLCLHFSRANQYAIEINLQLWVKTTIVSLPTKRSSTSCPKVHCWRYNEQNPNFNSVCCWDAKRQEGPRLRTLSLPCAEHSRSPYWTTA